MNEKRFSLFLVDDHKMFREGIKLLLQNKKEIAISGEASNGHEFLKLLKSPLPDIVLMDISMPMMDGMEATRLAIEKHPNLRILALSMYQDNQYYQKLIDYGVKGFVVKDADGAELIKAIFAVLNGGNYFSQELLQNIILGLNKQKAKMDLQSQLKLKLTQRELDVLKLLCLGKSTNEIGELLHISDKTVETHKSNLLAKTETKNSLNLVIFAFKNDLIEQF